MFMCPTPRALAAAALTCSVFAATAGALNPQAAPDYPPFDAVSKDLTKVVSTTDGEAPFYALWSNAKDGRLIAELPKNFDGQLIMLAPTVAGGNEEAGVMGGTVYAYWKQNDKTLLLIEPNYAVRSSGDPESQTSVKGLYSDRVLLDVPILTMGPGGGPVIDLKALFCNGAPRFFSPGNTAWGPFIPGLNPRLASLEKAKAFPQNIEITYRMPDANGSLVSLHYSLRSLPETPGYKPRVADSRVGYFYDFYNEMGTPGAEDVYTRYITRWHLEKADPNVKLSPPKQPIVWYIEHTTPIRYRRWVRDGILSWNKAFEKIGIVNALEVYQQDAATGAHMEKDPEDARYNFFRWNTSNQAYAIGPSRSDPRTGQIFDADVVWHAGLTGSFIDDYRSLHAQIASSAFAPETLAWLAENPEWDPRLRLDPNFDAKKADGLSPLAAALAKHPVETTEPSLIPPQRRGVAALASAGGSQCRIGRYMAMNINLFSFAWNAGLIQNAPEAGAAPADLLDGQPEDFLGPMIRYVSAHEVGHCLGLQHNFSSSTVKSLKQLNSPENAGQPNFGSVMEYAGININVGDGPIQGQYTTPCIGPYDEWAIAFGYGPEDQRAAILSRVAEPELIFHNDMFMSTADPRVMTWDMGADPLEFAESRMRLVKDLRAKLTTELVKDGQSWKKTGDRFNALFGQQLQSMAIASRWVGGTFLNRDFKGDPGNRNPIEDIPADTQRRALKFVIDNSFGDDVLGFTPDLLRKMGVESLGPDFWMSDPIPAPNSMMAAIQSTGLTMVMNPTTLRRVYDNEVRTSGTDNAITLAEVIATVSDAAWSEIASGTVSGSFTAGKPFISSYRRNLQREHLDRLIAFSLTPTASAPPSTRTIVNLSSLRLRMLQGKIDAVLKAGTGLDDYTRAHLTDATARITKALDAQYVYR